MDNSKKFHDFLGIRGATKSILDGLLALQEKKKNGESINEIDIVKDTCKKVIDSKKEWLEKNSKMFPKEVYEKLQTTLSNMMSTVGGLTETFLETSVTTMNGFNNTISKIFSEKLEEIVTYSIDVGEMSLDDYKNLLSTEYLTPEYKSALQDIIEKKEKEMAEQAAMEEEQGEKEEEKTEEKTEEKAEELSYADKIEQIKNAYQASKDVDKLEASMKAVLYEMMMAGKLTAENIALLDTVRELRTNEEQHEAGAAEEEKEEKLVNPEEITDPIELALLDLDISPEIKEAIRSLDPDMPVVDYAKAVSELITNDLKESIQKDIEAFEKKKNEKGKLSFMDNVRLSSLVRQQAQLNNGLNLSLHQKLNALIGAKKDKNMDTYINNAVEAKKTNEDKNSKYFTRLISAKRAEKFDKRIQELRAKNLVFNGEQIKTEIGSFDKKTRSLKLKSDFIAFNATLGNTVKSGYDKTARFIKSTPQKIEKLKQCIINLVEMPTKISDNVLTNIEKIENSRENKIMS